MTHLVKLKRMSPYAKYPTTGSGYAAGWDLYSVEEATIQPHQTVVLATGWAMELPNRYFGAIFARSGLATNEGLRPANCVGIVDEDYRGMVKVALHNDSDFIRYVNIGDRIAQLILLPYKPLDFQEVEELSDTKRGMSGFGSSGKQ